MNENLRFPEGFKWGSATSAHQVEGNNHNDWSEWEKTPARIDQLKKEGKNPDDFISGKACDSYSRYEEDFDIAKSLNQNIHRFSIEWSRIEPKEGMFDHEAMHHYINVVKALRERGIEPMITLWHFTTPVWFAEKGGFLNIDSPKIFTRYAKYVVDNLKDRVGLWITFNEAFTVYAGFTKLSAVWPSRGRGIINFLKVRKNTAKAHILAYQEIKKMCGVPHTFQDTSPMSHNVEIGIVENNVYVPDTKNLFTTQLRRLYKRLRNFYFFKNNTPYYDFIGLNYYHISRKPFFGSKNEVVPKQDFMKEMNWEIYPEGIYQVLKDLSKHKKPIYITENGIADGKDEFREKFIKEHLRWVWQAIHEGVDVRGYLYWSLLDNFEWARGFKPRFGLVDVDFNTFQRKIRPSALEYAKICKTNQLEINS